MVYLACQNQNLIKETWKEYSKDKKDPDNDFYLYLDLVS